MMHILTCKVPLHVDTHSCEGHRVFPVKHLGKDKGWHGWDIFYHGYHKTREKNY